MRAKSVWSICIAIAASVSAGALVPSASAAELVVQQGPREPQEERKAFHLPPGFEAQLVAAEPDIQKPIGINFDERGRLWVTGTLEYPFAAPPDRKGRDTIKILEDFAPDGKARKITTFADDLNIPISVLPYGDAHGQGAIVYSIPNIYRMSETNGSGKADRREIILSGIGHDDTHGMTGSFFENYDGWIYACHGFSNSSVVHAADGSEIKMQSGNTYRFRPDGSHVEYFTRGQVNPFGMTVDALGNIFSSDCETKPICLLLRGSYYPSFGKPHDGLGFGPEMVDHMYGSTAIAGLAIYAADAFPAEYRDRMLVGNVVTGRINNCKLEPRGSAFHGNDEPDFLTSDDPWFRPVNIKLGPDGALYVSDFYNRIIGHYEVDLHHPGRDKQRGRIWRIVYTGAGAKAPAAQPFDISNAPIPALIGGLADANLTVRNLAMNHLADRTGATAIEPLKAMLKTSGNAPQKSHALWILQRLNAFDEETFTAAARDADPIVRVHSAKILAEITAWNAAHQSAALVGLHDADPRVVRAAADAVGQHPGIEGLRQLLDLRHRLDPADAHLLHTVRMAIRNHLLDAKLCDQLPINGWSKDDERELADCALGAPTAEAGALLLRYLKHGGETKDNMDRALRHAARYVASAQVEELATFASTQFSANVDLQADLFKSVKDGIAQRGGTLGETTRAWGQNVAERIFASSVSETPEATAGDWRHDSFAGAPESNNPWVVQLRASADGNKSSPFWSSLPRGETLTGILRSTEFAIPAKLRFFVAGHNGLPPASHPVKNIIRLKLAGTNEVVAEALPPRNDLAQPVTWDLSAHAGQRGYIEATDGDTATAYAWLAFGRFDPPIVKIPPAQPVEKHQSLRDAIEIVGALKLSNLEPAVEKLLADQSLDAETRAQAAKTLAEVNIDAHAAALAAALEAPGTPSTLREKLATALATSDKPATIAARLNALRTAPGRLQLTLAKSLATTPGGAEALLQAVAEGKASPRLLLDANVKERLAVSKPADLDARIKQLAQGLPTADGEVQKLIDARVAGFGPDKGSPFKGARVFASNCVACHSVDGQGARVGPQLDGISKRGVPRIVEDILDPSRNVDVAFRYNTLVMTDGTILDGIIRRQEGDTIVIVDSTGKETVLPASQIKKRVESKLSLMPSNFGEAIKPADFNDLIRYLMTK
jgi:putative heme-binding domain-containing protein